MLIMIVDGDVDRRAGLCSLLSRQGHLLLVARNRTDALTILRGSRTPPKLILLDPHCGGIDATSFLEGVIHVAPETKILPLAIGRSLYCHDEDSRFLRQSPEGCLEIGRGWRGF